MKSVFEKVTAKPKKMRNVGHVKDIIVFTVSVTLAVLGREYNLPRFALLYNYILSHCVK